MKRPIKKININPKIVFIALAVVCAVLIFLSYKYSDKFAPIKAAFNNVITPMQKGIGSAGKAISDKLDMLSDIDRLLKENEELETELEKVKNENQMLLQEKYELNWYRDLYDLDIQYVDYPKVAARVISKDTNSYYNTFLIDKGRDHGIAVDMNVMAGNGLCGIVTEVGKNWAKVKTIIDDNTNVSGMFLKTSDTCIVSGDLELLDSGYIRVSMISPNAEVYDNYEIVTSHISDKYLPGILIGYVSNIEDDPSTMTKKAYLTPVVDFEHLEAVLIITKLREQLED